jgi:tetratricopeptide (TPR) repeat protein
VNRTHPLVRFVISLALLSIPSLGQEIFDQGVAAFRSNNYERALELFRQAAVLHPNQADPHAYLGATYMAISDRSAMLSAILKDPMRSADMPEADRLAAAKQVVSVSEIERLAEAELRRAVELDPNNMEALQSLVILANHGNAELSGPEKARRMAEAEKLYDRLTVAFADHSVARLAQSLKELRPKAAADSTGKEYAFAGELIETNVREAVRRARRNPIEAPGPLRNPMRQNLKERYAALINEAMGDFQQALRYDPANAIAMGGMSNLIRDSAALRDTRAEYEADIVVADAWMNRGFDTTEKLSQSPSSARPAQKSPLARTRVRVSEEEQMAKLIQIITPGYPPAAVQAHVTGTVRFALTVGRDGRAMAVRPIGGNPILFEAGQTALKQWIWKPTFVNGNLVEIETEVEVRFSSH